MKKNELKMGVILSYVTMFISFVIPLFYTPIMLRILGQNEYGVYSLANSVISYLALLNFGMGQSIIRYVSQYRAKNQFDKVNKIISLFFLVFIFLAFIVLIAGIILYIGSTSWFSKGLTITEISTLKKLIIIMTISTAVSFVSSVFSATTTAFEKYIFRRFLELINTMILPILNLIVLYLGYKSIGMSVIALLLSIILCFIYIYYCIKKLKVRISFKNLPFNLLKDIFSFSFFVFLSTIVDMLYWATDKVLIGSLLGSAAIAIYNIGGTFTSMYQNLSGAVGNVFGPRVNQMVAKENTSDKYDELLIRIGRIQFYIISLALTGYVVFGKIFIHFWAGDAYMDAYVIAIMTMFPLSIPLIQNIALTVTVAKNKHQFRAIMYFFIALANIVGTYILIPKYGIIGAAFCTSVSFIVGHGIIMNIFYYKVLKIDIPLFWKNILSISKVPLFMMVIGIIFVHFVSISSFKLFFICIFVYSCVYLILLYLISFNEYEKLLLMSPLFKIFNKVKSIINKS